MMVVPIVPPVDEQLLDGFRRSRRAAYERLASLPPGAAGVFRWWARRRIQESLANLFLDDRPLLMPPRRRHLHERFEARIAGCSAAYRHLDSRIQMFRLDHVPLLVGAETPYVVNALAESHDPGRSETNPGLPRYTDARFDETQTAFLPPPCGDCAELVTAAVDVANVDDVPLVVRAGWLCATLLAVHPFVDGNGRTARLLFQFLSSADPELGVDWGAVEQWAMYRQAYISALKRSQSPSVPDYDGRLVDTLPFIEFGVRSSTEGAEVTLQRAEWFERAWQELGDAVDDSEPAATIELAVASAWSASIAELDELVADPIATSTVNRLVADGRLEWDRRRLLRLAPGHPLLAMR